MHHIDTLWKSRLLKMTKLIQHGNVAIRSHYYLLISLQNLCVNVGHVIRCATGPLSL